MHAMVRDATAAFKPEAMEAAHGINGPTYAHEIVGSQQLIAALQAAPTHPTAARAA